MLPLKSFFHFFLPYTCLLCQKPSNQNLDLCEDCEKELNFIHHACLRCGKPLSPQIEICGDCLKDPPYFRKCIAIFQYDTLITKLIRNLKFHHQLVNAQILGLLMAKYLKNREKPDYLIPVPLHPFRLKERGFNQAFELARPIKKQLDIPIDITHCHRIRFTYPQFSLRGKYRYHNVKNAFYIDPHFKPKQVAIIDDVMTTGNTVNELSKALINNGTQKIDIWCCARTVLTSK